MNRWIRKTVSGAAAFAVATSAGVAFAAWAANGSGTGYAQARARQAITATGVAPTADLYPGSVGDLGFTANNPNPYPVMITSVSLGTGSISPANCSITFTPQSGLSLYVPAGGSGTFTLNDAVAMGHDAADSCSGATIAIPIALTGTNTPPTTAAPAPSSGPTLNDTPIAEGATLTSASSLSGTFNTTSWLGQSFTRTASGVVTGAAVYINGGTLSGGSATVKVWAVTDTGALGNELSSQTVSNLSGTSGQWMLLALPQSVPVGTRFAIGVKPAWSDNFYARRSTTNPYSGGAMVAGCPCATGGADNWGLSGTDDLVIKVYGS
ncbi:MAG: hypothetical protein ACLGHT_08790 [Acidimicrobiia bacterium]